MGETMTWWHRQRAPLVALAVAAIAAVGVHVWMEAVPLLPRMTDDVTVVGQRASIAGHDMSLGRVQWNEFDAPTGSRTLSIRLEADGGAEATTCGAFTLTEPSSGRLWENARSALAVPYDAGESGCGAESFPYEILAVFLVPDDALGPFAFDVPDADGVIARFVVTP